MMTGPDNINKQWTSNEDDVETKKFPENFENPKIEEIVKTGKIEQIKENKDVIKELVYGKNREFACDVCPNLFVTLSYLKKHQLKVHSAEGKFICLVCSKVCMTKGKLEVHMRCHTGETKHDQTMLQCHNCGKQFSRKTHLNCHIKYVHLKVAREKSKKRIRPKRRRGFMPQRVATIEEKTCPKCGIVFKKPATMKGHLGRHALNSGDVKITDYYSKAHGSLFTCNNCKKEFAVFNNIREHVINRHIIVVVNAEKTELHPITGSSDKNPSKMGLHTKVNQDNYMDIYLGKTEDNKVECKECRKFYTSLKNLKEHVLNFHLQTNGKQSLVKPSKDFISFLTELNAELSGQDLVLVLDFLRNLKESNNTELLGQIMEDGKNGYMRKIFEDMGVLQSEDIVKTESDYSVYNIKTEPEEKAIVPLEKKETRKYIKKDTGDNKFMEESPTSQLEQKGGPEKWGCDADRTCNICKRIFLRISKMKIHKVTHTKVFQNLSIDNKVDWSEDRTKLTCLDCGKKFTSAKRMKIHIAVTHYQLHNLDF